MTVENEKYSMSNSPFEGQGDQPAAGLAFTCPQNYHSANLGDDVWSACQYPTCCWLYRPELPLQISIYPNSSQCCFALILYIGPKIPPPPEVKLAPPPGIKLAQYPWYEITEVCLKPWGD